MKKIIILGGGTAGTIMANKLRRALNSNKWAITIVDKDKLHYYQPGFLFIPFGIYNQQDVTKPKTNFFPSGVDFIFQEVEKIVPTDNHVILKDGEVLQYDILIIATGAQLRPDQTPGLTEKLWYKKIFHFYTLDGALALQDYLKKWDGGNLVIAIAEMPYKCPVAPLEFAFLADDYFKKVGIRNKVNIKLVTPLSGAFTKPIASRMLEHLLIEKNIEIVSDFYLEKVDNETQCIFSYDGREVPFDLLVIIPVNMGDEVIARSNLGDELNYVPTDKNTLQSKAFENIFVIGDAADLPTSKAGSVAHYATEILSKNIINYINGKPLEAKFDGHATCFIETEIGKASLIDFNYDVEPLPGKYPLPIIGPFELLKNTRINHYGKMSFKWIYWHMILKGRELPFSPLMTMSGKCKNVSDKDIFYKQAK